MDPISKAADAELDKLMAALPSTGKGAAHITLTNDGARVDVATRWTPNLSSSIYWQKPKGGPQTWGTKTTFQW